MQKHREDMLKAPRRPPRQPANRCGKEEFVCQGWDSSMPPDKDEDFIFCSSTWKCKYLNSNSLVIAPTLYHRMSESKYKADHNSQSFPNVLDSPLLTNTTKQADVMSKTKPSGLSTIKYSTMNKDFANAIESGSRVKRLICFTDNKTSRRYKLDRAIASEEKVNISVDQGERQENVTKTPASILCVIHSNKNINSEDVGLRDDNDIIEKYKDAIAILRGKTAWKSCLNPSECLKRNSFHGHIQTCILKLSNQSPIQPTKLISCDDNSLFLKSASGKVKGFERQSQRFQTGHHHGPFPTSPIISMSKVCKTDGEKFEWSQNTQEISRVATSDDKPGLVRIFPLSSGKENAVEMQRNQSAPRHITSSQSHLRNISDRSKDLVPSGSQVTLGLMLNAIKNGLKENQARVMLGQTIRFMEA